MAVVPQPAATAREPVAQPAAKADLVEPESPTESEGPEEPEPSTKNPKRKASILEMVGHVQGALESRKGQTKPGRRPKCQGSAQTKKPGRPPKAQAPAAGVSSAPRAEKLEQQKPACEEPPAMHKDGRPAHFGNGIIYTDKKRKVFRVIQNKKKSRSDTQVRWGDYGSMSKAWDQAIDLIKFADR